MILADDIIGSAGTERDRTMFGAIAALAREVSSAQRFRLDRQTVFAAMGVSHSSPKSIMSARAFARTPYEKIWIEWRFQDILDAIGKPLRQIEGRYAPERVGCLVESMPGESTAGMMTLAWGDKHRVEQSLFCQIYDIGEEPPELDRVASHFVKDGRIKMHDDQAEVREGLFRHPDTIADSTLRYLKRDPDQIDCLVDELSRFDFVNNPRTRGFVAYLHHQAGVRDPNPFLRDWEREALTVISALILMNSRDLAVQEPVSQVRLNRKRAKRGKLPLVGHTIIRLGSGMGVPRGGSRSASAAHLVRGHFKVRKTGVWWWNPHVRGEGRQADRAAYEVRT